MVIRDFMDCMSEMIHDGFDPHKNDTKAFLEGIFEYMRQSGCTKECDYNLFIDILNKNYEEED